MRKSMKLIMVLIISCLLYGPEEVLGKTSLLESGEAVYVRTMVSRVKRQSSEQAAATSTLASHHLSPASANLSLDSSSTSLDLNIETTKAVTETTGDVTETTRDVIETTEAVIETTKAVTETTRDVIETTEAVIETMEDVIETTEAVGDGFHVDDFKPFQDLPTTYAAFAFELMDCIGVCHFRSDGGDCKVDLKCCSETFDGEADYLRCLTTK